MPKILLLSERSDAGAKSLDFSMDGKEYVALPKHGQGQEWLDEFKKLLQFSAKYNLNPFATPLKEDPTKADKFKKMRMFDRIKYSWNTDTSTKEGPRKGLKEFIDVISKDKMHDYFERKRIPEVEQMKMKLSSLADKLQKKGLPEESTFLRNVSNNL